ncbi:unnamed protein product [Acanthosepion pharaonis]|uniref:Uncharacterized protein n=1 Tax=Acanthosepion pharaonis TaxID=158019 RepID=A0A812DUM0_ACAPH|nr:unnamed protein product [Sepia pharaonis]
MHLYTYQYITYLSTHLYIYQFFTDLSSKTAVHQQILYLSIYQHISKITNSLNIYLLTCHYIYQFCIYLSASTFLYLSLFYLSSNTSLSILYLNANRSLHLPILYLSICQHPPWTLFCLYLVPFHLPNCASASGLVRLGGETPSENPPGFLEIKFTAWEWSSLWVESTQKPASSYLPRRCRQRIRSRTRDLRGLVPGRPIQRQGAVTTVSPNTSLQLPIP